MHPPSYLLAPSHNLLKDDVLFLDPWAGDQKRFCTHREQFLALATARKTLAVGNAIISNSGECLKISLGPLLMDAKRALLWKQALTR